jgi:hypothetical protein
MDILEKRQKFKDDGDMSILICGICGREISLNQVEGTFDGIVHDWGTKAHMYDVSFHMCQECFINFIKNYERKRDTNLEKGGV